MAGPDPTYDLGGALTNLAPGIVVQKNLIDAGYAAYANKGFVPLAASDVPGILAAANGLVPVSTVLYATTEDAYPLALPPYPIGLPRFPDSNPDPLDQWVQFGPEGPGVI